MDQIQSEMQKKQAVMGDGQGGGKEGMSDMLITNIYSAVKEAWKEGMQENGKNGSAFDE